MGKEFDSGPNRTDVPTEVFAAFADVEREMKPDPADNATELHPDDLKAFEEFEKARKESFDRDAERYLEKIKTENPY